MSVAICTAVKDCAMWLPRFFKQLDKLSDVSRVIFIYGKSKDKTLELIKDWSKHTRHPVQVCQEPDMPGILTSAELGALCRDFQEIVRRGEDEWALLADADVMSMPADLIQKLQKHDKDIVAPYVYVMNHVPPGFYDTFCFRLDGCRFHPYKPPMNKGRLLQLDSVGTVFLAKREVFLDVPYGNPYPHMKFCNDARAKGYEVWADPKTTVLHVDLTRFGIMHYPLEHVRGLPPDKTPFIRDGREVVSLEQLQLDYVSAFVWGEVK